MSTILVETTGPVMTVTLNRPEKRNALDTGMLKLIKEAFDAPPEPGVRVAVVRAKGQGFCSGLDLRELTEGGGVRGAPSVEDAFHSVQQYPLPVVAVVQGDAIAGGNELALHCDLVVASTRARFGMSLAQIGLAPPWALTCKLLEVGGPVAAREVLFLGDPLPAERMHALGIVSFLAAPEELEDVAAKVIERLTANAPLSLRTMKAALLRGMAFREGLPHEDIDAMITTARRSADAQEGITARLERRTAVFRGE